MCVGVLVCVDVCRCVCVGVWAVRSYAMFYLQVYIRPEPYPSHPPTHALRSFLPSLPLVTGWVLSHILH